MPKQPMKPRQVRTTDALWAASKRRADERDETVSDAVRRFLEDYAFDDTHAFAYTPNDLIEQGQALVREHHPEVWNAWVRWCKSQDEL